MFDICIVFEANQITDAQLMIPLLVQPKKLILVGDNHTVRPTVWSAELLKVKYQQSLFSRMVDHFTREPENSPVYTLNTQYRMHSQISRYISKEVYGYCLLDSDTVLIRDFLLKRKIYMNLKNFKIAKATFYFSIFDDRFGCF